VLKEKKKQNNARGSAEVLAKALHYSTDAKMAQFEHRMQVERTKLEMLELYIYVEPFYV